MSQNKDNRTYKKRKDNLTDNLLPSVAIALYVKNEFSDIAGWISWHFALGVKTLFIFDDHSTDGTWEIIQAAAKCYDIRFTRTSPELEADFTKRQRDSFFMAARECKGKYDWLGCLDGDEYVYLRHSDSLPDFLSKFNHADAIGFSWKIYGSSDRVLRPRIPAPQAFTRHSTKELNDNVLIKSFFRPDKLGEVWYNPHFFDIPKGRYVRPDGSFMREERAEQPIEWDDAYILHFITRSMAQYIERIRRRVQSDLCDSQVNWAHFNRNDIEDLEPLRLMPKVRKILLPINNEIIRSAITLLKMRYLNLVTEKGTEPPIELPRVYEVTTCWGTSLCYSLETETLVHADLSLFSENKLVRVLAACYPSSPNLATLYRVDDVCNPVSLRSPLTVTSDERELSNIIYYVERSGNVTISLRSPLNALFLGAAPPIEGSFGNVTCDREEINDWEKMEFHELDLEGEIDNPLQSYVLPNMSNMVSFERFIVWLVSLQDEPDPDTFLRVLYALDPKVRADVDRHAPGLLHAFI